MQVTTVANIHRDLEAAFRLRASDTIPLPQPTSCGACECSEDILATLSPEPPAGFSDSGDGAVLLTLAYSAPSDAGVLACLR